MAQVQASPSRPHRWAETYPELGTGPVSAEVCVSPDYFEREREKIFLKVWWKVARDEELPRSGDFKVKFIPFARASVIVVRGRDGRVRAHYNQCAHRGNTVISPVPGEWEFFGRARAHALTCRFHGWVYGTDGKLLYVPRKERFAHPPVCGEEGLVSLPCDTWEGFIFINFDPAPRQTLAEYLGDYGRHLAGYDYARCSRAFRYWTVLDANWKICLDAFEEGYHVDTIHAGTFPCDGCWLDHIQFFGSHRTSVVFFKLESAPPGPVQRIAFRHTSTSCVNLGGPASMLTPQLNPTRSPHWSFELSTLFPSFMIHPAEGFWFTHHFWPIAHDKTLWEGINYLPPATTPSERFSLEFSNVLSRNAWLEDTETMENTHRALASRGRRVIHLQDEEILLRHGYHVVDAWVNDRPILA